MQITRREMLARSGQAGAALALAPIAQAAKAISPEPIKIKTGYGRKALHRQCQFAKLPKDYPLHEWLDVKKKDSQAFTAYCSDLYPVDCTEEFAKHVLINELAGRAESHFLPRLQADNKDFKKDVIERRVPDYLFYYLYWQTENFLDEMKDVPHPGTRIPNGGLIVGSTEFGSYQNYFNTNRNFIRNHPGIFTNFTEEEADEIVYKLTQIPYDKVYEYVRGKLEEYYSYAKLSNLLVASSISSSFISPSPTKNA